MSEKMKQMLGEDLYKQVAEKMGEIKFDILDGYIPKARFNEVNEKNKLFEEKISSYEKQMNSTKNLLKDNEELKAQYSKIQDEHKELMKQKDKEIGNILKKSMFKEILNKEGAKHPDLLMRDIDWDVLSIDNNNLIGANEKISEIKTNYADLFVTKTTEGNTPTKTETKTTSGSDNPFDRFK
jgi:rhamnose utilization protein RhaD (predicted bifunctional aldolase and dehydrogenase)